MRSFEVQYVHQKQFDYFNLIWNLRMKILMISIIDVEEVLTTLVYKRECTLIKKCTKITFFFRVLFGLEIKRD